MIRNLKKYICVFIILCLIITTNIPTKAAINIPDNIKIGLFYKGTSVTEFKVSAEKGLQFGYSNNNFKVLLEEGTNNCVIIRKDSYFANNSGVLKEYSPTSSSIPTGEKTGPLHIQIGNTYDDYQAAADKVEILKQDGINAFPAYVGTWQVWTGFFTDKNSAKSEIDKNLSVKLDNVTFSIIDASLSINRIVVLSSEGNVKAVFGSAGGVFQIHPKDENKPYIFKLNNKTRYRGDIEVRRLSGSDMTVINILPLEKYLYGVIPCEIGASSAPEALKAQAVTARTYALSSMNKYTKYYFNLSNTTDCQVYGGYDKEEDSSNNAIDNTKSKVLIYNGDLAQTFFFSSSGGYTEDCKNVWGSDIPYLKSVEDKYESGKSYNYSWSQTFSADRIKQILQGKGNDVGDILSVEVTKVAATGRAIELVIKGTKGQKTYIRESCRTILGLPSQQFKISTDSLAVATTNGKNSTSVQLNGKKVITSGGVKTIGSSNVTIKGASGQTIKIPSIPTTYKITGKGWGHAVGMSQEGARGMANQGYSYIEILTHYYTGTKVQ